MIQEAYSLKITYVFTTSLIILNCKTFTNLCIKKINMNNLPVMERRKTIADDFMMALNIGR